MKTGIAVVFAVIVLTPILVAIQNQPSRTQDRKAAQQATPATPVSVNCNCTTKTENGQDKPQGWHKFVAWPEGIATWALILTLGAIWWQSWETRKSAKAAKDGVEMQISKERARIKIIVQDVKGVVSGNQVVVVWQENYGETTAFLKECRVRYVRAEREIVPDYTKCRTVALNQQVPPEIRRPASEQKQGALILLEPSDILTEEEALSVRKEESFLHVYGFARYRDLFDRNWRVNIHLRFRMLWGGTFPGKVNAWWEIVGLSEENADLPDNPPVRRWWKFEWLREAIEKQTGAQNPN